MIQRLAPYKAGSNVAQACTSTHPSLPRFSDTLARLLLKPFTMSTHADTTEDHTTQSSVSESEHRSDNASSYISTLLCGCIRHDDDSVWLQKPHLVERKYASGHTTYTLKESTLFHVNVQTNQELANASHTAVMDEGLTEVEEGSVWMHFPDPDGNPRRRGTWTFMPPKGLTDPDYGPDFSSGLIYTPPFMLQCILPGDEFEDDETTAVSHQGTSGRKKSTASGRTSKGRPQEGATGQSSRE